MSFTTKRIYEPSSRSDGTRVLVDRLWPRGISRERADLDDWFKDIAPSTELREWFGHVPERYDEFVKRYRKELEADPEKRDEAQVLLDMAEKGKVTLLYAARNEDMNEAVVLEKYLTERMQAKKP